jgi:type I restriction enzyme M protein
VVFYGQEKNRDTIRIAKMNLAVHGLEGKIAEAITYYQDEHNLHGRCDFVMANPPFNVDLVDAERIKGDPRLPFGLPGVNKQKKVGNGNYLWISYFWSYLNARRAAPASSCPPRLPAPATAKRKCARSWWKPATWT